MFIVKKALTPFLLPPGLFVLLAAALAIRLLFRKKLKQAGLLLLAGGFIWGLSTAPTADAILGRLESGYSIPPSPKGDVIIMLGGAIFSKSPDLSGIGVPGYGTMERLVTAARLHKRIGAPILISGGRVFSEDGAIASIAARFLQDLGISAESILIEDRSRDTYENALYSAQICRQKGFRTPLLVTSGFHLKRALFCFDDVGLSVQPFPCGLTTWPDKTYHWTALLPGAGALQATAIGLHETIGLMYYQLRY